LTKILINAKINVYYNKKERTMKKLIKILAVCLLIAIVAMTFTSCGLFSSKADKIKDRLKDEDYAVASRKSSKEINI
jgi:hypothetical protein